MPAAVGIPVDHPLGVVHALRWLLAETRGSEAASVLCAPPSWIQVGEGVYALSAGDGGDTDVVFADPSLSVAGAVALPGLLRDPESSSDLDALVHACRSRIRA